MIEKTSDAINVGQSERYSGVINRLNLGIDSQSALSLEAEADNLVIGISKLRLFCRVTELLVEADKFVHINIFIEAP
jgi:hypothetical protein